MTNEQKFKMPEERIAAFNAVCDREDGNCINCPIGFRTHKETIECFAHWLTLEAEEEKPETCPFCGGEMRRNSGHIIVNSVHYWVDCINPECMYRSAHYTDADSAIAAHNRVARAVRAAEKGETK